MKHLARIVLVLCSCVTACNREDTVPQKTWLRTTEARVAEADWSPCNAMPLTGDRVVTEVRCEKTELASDAPCELDPPTRDTAVAMLLRQPQCTDAAVSALESVVLAEPDALSDLAAAYYTRAQRDDRATDLFRALDAATRAVKHAPTPEAHFNLGLTQEALGLDEEAIATWKKLPDEESQGHRRRLEAAVDAQAEFQGIDAALKRGDEKEVARLVQPVPKTALRYLHMMKERPASEVAMLARVLSLRLRGDPYPTAVAAKGIDLEKPRRDAIQLTLGSEQDRGLALLEKLEAEASRSRYRHMQALLRASRGYALWKRGDFLGSFAAYDAAMRDFNELGDLESIGDSRSSSAGILNEMAQYEAATRELLRALPARHVADSRTKQKMFGELAFAAKAIGEMHAALAIQTIAVKTAKSKIERAIALRELSAIELAADDPVSAQHHLALALAEAKGADDAKKDADVARSLAFRLAQRRGQLLLRTNPRAAVTELSRGLAELTSNEYPTLRANLLIDRARAHQALKDRDATKQDLADAVEILSGEERRTLQRRRPGEGEELWSAYFSRPMDAYRRLIELLVEENRYGEAFDYAERSRSLEVVDLVRMLPFAPPGFLKLTEGGKPIGREELQQQLPEGTFLLQYCVAPTRVIVWIVSRHVFEPITWSVARSEVDRRSHDLQRAGRNNDETAFDNASRAAYDLLMREPFDRILELNGGKPPARLAIVPDGSMHGLPFAALRNPDTGHYLIQHMPIEVEASATLYIFALMRHAALDARPSSALIVAAPTFDRTLPLAYGLGNLPGSKEEASQLRKEYPRAKELSEGDATIAAFFEYARDKDVIHFAGHSVVNEQRPWSSILLFAPNQADRGVIEAAELVGRQLPRTRLVFLASCSSAGGAPVGAEGVAPLVRPLIATGVPAIVGTLWDVKDATFVKPSVSFHHDFIETGDAAAALRNAQLEQIRTMKSIKFWAPFQVVGH